MSSVSAQTLLTVAEMGRLDRAAIAAGTPGLVLMERAGKAVADAVSRRLRRGERVLVVCGPGNNGGDGFVAARLLKERGHDVTLLLAAEPAALKGDALAMSQLWKGACERFSAVAPADYALIVDALFGAGLNRPLTGEVAGFVARINAAGVVVVSVDVPSGLSGDTGQVESRAILATETVTFVRLKPGHLLYPGRALCGVVTLVDIGIGDAIGLGAAGIVPSLFCNGPALWRDVWPVPGAEAHKYQRGSVLVVAGGLSGVGAPRLGARAALRVGAGLVTIACAPDALAAHAARGPDALMQRPIANSAALEALLCEPRLSAVLIGPALGLDAGARHTVRAVLQCDAPAVLDADALTLLAPRIATVKTAVMKRGGPCVLTPHEGEFSRLFGAVPAIMAQRSKVERARAAAEFSGCVVVLKGADTVIAAPDGRCAVNMTGTVALATAGSGDVLGGLIVGLLAQGMPAFEAACAAVWLHGCVGERLGTGLIADDLPDAIAPLLQEIGALGGAGD